MSRSITPTAYRMASSRAVLFEYADLDSVLWAQASLTQKPVKGQQDIVAAAETILVELESSLQVAAAIEDITTRTSTDELELTSKVVTIDTIYDGEDLEQVARLAGLTEDPAAAKDAVVSAHTGMDWIAAFGGFAPGFAYLVPESVLGEDGAPHPLTVPRLETPRAKVPAGAVALAAGFSAVYPAASPGGWQLIGRTKTRMWDLSQDQPALIQPGDKVRFRAVREQITLPALKLPNLLRQANHLEIRDPGLYCTVQDLGRPGHAHVGVTRSGAADRTALRRANGYVGNPEGAACLEIIGGTFRLAARTDQVIAVAGADTPLEITTPDGGRRRIVPEAAVQLKKGDRLHIKAPTAGLRSYLAVRGGFDVRKILDSCSTDSLSGVGPAPLKEGDKLAVREAEGKAIIGEAGALMPNLPAPGRTVTLRVALGPREDWFTPESLEEFFSAEYEVTQRSNRVGVRFNGPALTRSRTGELPSEGTVAGALQIPADGSPVLFLQDHPVTGGYPVLGAVVEEDQWMAGQLPPGARVRFVRVPSSEGAVH